MVSVQANQGYRHERINYVKGFAMPFVAMRKSTGERINILEMKDPRLVIEKGDLVCPLCGVEFLVVAGPCVVRHFRHKVLCTSTIDRHPESAKHLVGKWHVWDYCQKMYGDDVRVDFEVNVSEVNRQADLMVSFPTGYREAHEIQLSSISRDQLRQRTVDYRKAGIDSVVWWFGESANTQANRDWAVDTFGDVRVITFKTCSYDNE